MERVLKPTLREFAAQIQRETQLATRTSIPAKVLEYDDVRSTAKLELSFQPVERGDDGTEIVRPAFVLTNVPVFQLGGASSYIRQPLEVGDTGVVSICDRAIGAWRTDGGAHPPDASWTHNLGDALFFPGFRPDSAPLLPATMGGTLVEGSTIQLGAGATLGAARSTDPVVGSSQLSALLNAINAALAALGGIPTNAAASAACGAVAALVAPALATTGNIGTASTKTFVE